MGLAVRRIKVYGKLVAIIAVVTAGLLVVLMNLGRSADVWFFREYPQVPTFWLILITAAAAIIGWWGFWRVSGVLREVREHRRTAQADRQRAATDRVARDLAEREKRLDRKLRSSITDGPGG